MIEWVKQQLRFLSGQEQLRGDELRYMLNLMVEQMEVLKAQRPPTPGIEEPESTSVSEKRICIRCERDISNDGMVVLEGLDKVCHVLCAKMAPACIVSECNGTPQFYGCCPNHARDTSVYINGKLVGTAYVAHTMGVPS